jgi:anti-sigma B factor antagonist
VLLLVLPLLSSLFLVPSEVLVKPRWACSIGPGPRALNAPDQSRRFRSGLFSLESALDGETRTLRLHGELDLATAGTLQEALEEAFDENGSLLVLDLSALTFIDSTGIALLIGAIGREADGVAVRFVPSQAPAVTRVLKLTGVDERMRTL